MTIDRYGQRAGRPALANLRVLRISKDRCLTSRLLFLARPSHCRYDLPLVTTLKKRKRTHLINPLEAARILARERADSIVVPHPANERYWGAVSGTPGRDFMPPQSDGEEAAFALGLAMAAPGERVIILDTDESLLSNLGVLVTISDAAPANLVHVLFQSGVRNGAAGLPLPGGNHTDFAAIARGAGYASASLFEDLEELAGDAAQVLATPGPTLLVIKIDPSRSGYDATEPPRRYDMSDTMRDYRASLKDKG